MVMAVALALLSLGIMWKAGEAPWGAERFSNVGFNDAGAPAGGFWPFWVAGIMFVCSVWVFVNGLLKRSPVAKRGSEPYLDRHGIMVLITVAIPVFLLVLLTQYISMYFAMALFIFYYLSVLGRHGLVLSLAMAVVLPFWMFLFFDITMTTTLPKGVLAIENNIYAPLGTWFRKAGGGIVGACFVGGAVVLALASWVAARRGRAG